MKNLKKKKNRVKTQVQLDEELENEFLTTDLGDQLRGRRIKSVRPREKLTSIFLPPTLIEELKKKGEIRGIGYQTMLKIIVHENLNRY